MKKPIAVLISDIHFTPATLDVATAAFKQAQAKALGLGIPLIACGDTLDTKAIMRAECVNRLIALMSSKPQPETIFLVGNHDKINEKGDEHTLNFLRPYAAVIDYQHNMNLDSRDVTFIPYQHDTENLKRIIRHETTSDIIIMHQGIKNANGGHYYQDATAVDASMLAGKIVISGHYHARQGIDLADGGTFDYVGNPYTLNYGEANDLEKGFQVLYADGSLEFIPTNLRKHVVINTTTRDLDISARYSLDLSGFTKPGDLVWLKLTGPSTELQKISRSDLISKGWPETLKLDLIPDDTEFQVEASKQNQTQEELLDSVIDSINTDDSQKQLLKNMWREMR